MTPEAIAALAAQQDAILAAAERALRPGGTLVYSTCTISREEERYAGEERVQTLPHKDDTDGFYIARGGRRGEPRA
jgi:16S rRNA C967 or C1407 C5-methylase (RsmB/RsmF family)